ncbi:unnamed protein product [Heterobilharzia americana]|nr:unnamed protein product [Heterobilharzia americana]
MVYALIIIVSNPNQQLTTFCGSPAYAAPELFQSQSYRGGPVDMWALGIVLFFMLTGLLPFRGSTVGQVRRLVLDNCGLQPPDSLSPAAADLYRNLTARSPDMRPTTSQLIKYAQYARKDLSTIEISLRQRSTWTSWLAGQTFPKPLPRFKHCPPLPSTLRAQQKSSPPRPSTSSESKSASNQIDQKLSVHQNSSSTTNHQMLNSTETLTSSLVNNQSVNTTNHNQNKSVVCENNRKLRKKLSKCQTITKDSLDNDEVEAANLLLNLGITPEEIQSSHNYESRSAVTGAYRIMLHKIHRSRRLSRLDQVINTLGNNENYNPTKFTATLPTIKSSTSITTRQNIHETPVDTSTVNVADNQNTEKTKDQVKFHTLPRLKQISQPSVKQSNPSSFDQSKKKLHQKSQEKSQSKLCHLI